MAKTTAVTVEYAGRSFKFDLCQRKLELGPAGSTDYFWMDGRKFRQRGASGNFRSCVDLWWSAVEAAGKSGEPDDQVSLALAEAFPLFSSSRALQSVYLDAHLHKTADRTYEKIQDSGPRQIRTERTYQLPDDERQRLQQLAHSGDVDRIRAELDSLFHGELPPQEESPAFDRAFQSWVGNALVAFRKSGRDGLQHYIQSELKQWVDKLRKRGGIKRVHTFLNLFGYECKAAFYLCHASAWVGLLATLERERAITEPGERFMRLWHNQNQPQETPDGKLVESVFRRQVLSLHPLSGIVMSDPAHLEVIGRWVTHPEYVRLQESGRAQAAPSYHDFVATILIAAHEYKRSHTRWAETRKHSTIVASTAVEQTTRDDSSGSVALLFEDYAASRGTCCPDCAGLLRFDSYEPPSVPDEPVTVTLVCCSCAASVLLEVGFDELRQTV